MAELIMIANTCGSRFQQHYGTYQRVRMRYVIVIFCVLALSGVAGSTALALGLDDIETFERLESMDLFDAAISAAEADDIPRARALLEQALGTSGAVEGRARAERSIAAAENRERERILAEEEARRLAAEAEERRRAEEAARAAAAATSRPSGGASSGGGHRCIAVHGECISGFGCIVDDLRITAGSGVSVYTQIDNSSRTHSIICILGTVPRNEIAGVYRYTMRIRDTVCSGQFSISTRVQQSVTVNVYASTCNLSYVNER